MREILFRGKRLDNGEWIEGCLFKLTLNGEVVNLIFEDSFSFVGNNVKALSHAPVDPNTVGQYTGLNDKNGKRIFEGDIAETSDFNSEDGYGEIIWDEQTARFAISGSTNILFADFDNYFGNEIEVIGNIHDNPELLKGAD